MPATTRPVTTHDRTYATYYIPDVNGQRGHDQVIFHHPNGLCVVCLSERHPMCVGDGEAASIATTTGCGGGGVGGVEDSTTPACAGHAIAGDGKRKREDASQDTGRVVNQGGGDDAVKPAASGSEPALASASYGAVAEVDFR